jgi:hypothetical protein
MGLNNGFYSRVYKNTKCAATYVNYSWNSFPKVISDIIWGPNPGRLYADLSKDFGGILPKKFRENFDAKFVQANNVKNVKKVYFHPKSKFPRERLGLTKIKRCLKPENADYIVAPNYSFVNFNFHALHTWENSATFLFSSDDRINVKKATETMNKLSQDQYEYKGIKTYMHTLLTDSWMLALYDTPYTNYITDTEFEKVCSRYLPTITMSDVKGVESLLKSNDAGNTILALKSLYGYSFIDYSKVLASIVCMYFKNISTSSEYTTKMFQHFKKCIGLVNYNANNFCAFPYWLTFLDSKGPLIQPEKEEREILEYLIHPLYEEYISRFKDKILDWSDTYNFCPVVKLYLDKNDRFDKLLE